MRTAEEAYADEIERLNDLLKAGAIDQETFARASEQADDRMLRSSREWSDGVRRAIRDYLDDATDAAKTFEQATTRALKASEDAFVEWAMTGKFSAKDLFNTIAEEALRAAYRMAVVAPLNNILGTIFGAIGGSIFGGTGVATTSSGTPMIGDFPVSSGPTAFAHTGGIIGRDAFPTRMVNPRAFDGASRYHRGGIVGGEMPIVARSPVRACSRPDRCKRWPRSRTPSPWSMSRSTSATPRPAPRLPPMCGASRAAISPSTS